ncbi:MAG: hypothetical protein IKQ08_08045 [Paludibacteraceae bacterium]|nr:hypothetical protein [Paludibacteraceae bacterium]
MTKYNLKELLLSDLFRYTGKIGIGTFIKTYFSSSGFKFTVWLRVCYVLRQHKLFKYTFFPFCKLLYDHYKFKYGYDIPYSIEIGPGLLLFHFGGIVFNPKSCGKNATISHCTTVGMTIHNGKKCYPLLGDNIYIAPGAKIIGDIKVANNTAIGSNAVLTKSTEINDVVVGIPGKSISSKGSFEYVNFPV